MICHNGELFKSKILTSVIGKLELHLEVRIIKITVGLYTV